MGGCRAVTEKFDAASGFKTSGTDAEIEAAIAEHCERYGIAPLDAVKNFAILARRQALKRFLAHTELFKQTLEVPGDIAEIGVYRGLGLMTWANLLEAYCIGNRTKTVYGFDNWAGFKGFATEDGALKERAGKVKGGYNPSSFRQELEDAIAIFDRDRFIPWKPRVKLIDGDVEETAARFVTDNPGVRFSLIHFDCDLYKPTRAGLEAFWPRVSRGGIVMFDEYGIPDWPGETAAVDEFIAGKPDLRLKTFTWTNTPTAWIVKP
jgi:hypothetical protein